MNMLDAIEFLEKDLNQGEDLPEELWYFISRHTPIVNVDLIIKNEKSEILLTWRDDKFYDSGWHIPGGVVRYRESIQDRIQKTAISEIGAVPAFGPTPLVVNEVFTPKDTRGHFISLGFECFLPKTAITETNKMQWWHQCPANLIAVHKMYKRFFISLKYM